MCRLNLPPLPRLSIRPMAELAKPLWPARNALIPSAEAEWLSSQKPQTTLSILDKFDGDCCCFAAADAERSNSAAEFALRERRKQRDNDARA